MSLCEKQDHFYQITTQNEEAWLYSHFDNIYFNFDQFFRCVVDV